MLKSTNSQKLTAGETYKKENIQAYQEIFSSLLEEHFPLTEKEYTELKNIQRILQLSDLEVQRAIASSLKCLSHEVKDSLPSEIIPIERLKKNSLLFNWWVLPVGGIVLILSILFLGLSPSLQKMFYLKPQLSSFLPAPSKPTSIPLFELDLDKSKSLSSLVAVNSLVISPDGKKLVIAGEEGKILIKNLMNEKQINLTNNSQNHINCMAISADGKHLVIGDVEGILKLWNLETNQYFQHGNHSPNAISAITISNDGAQIISGDIEGTIRVTSRESGVINTLKGHSAGINGLALTPDQKIISVSNDWTIRIWDLATGELLWVERSNRPITTVAIANNNQFITGSADGTIAFWDWKTYEELGTYKSHSEKISSSATTNSILITGSNDRTMRIWNLVSKNNQQLPQMHQQYVNSVGISSDGQTLVSASKEQIYVWHSKN
jgi:WD40 repeat protein